MHLWDELVHCAWVIVQKIVVGPILDMWALLMMPSQQRIMIFFLKFVFFLPSFRPPKLVWHRWKPGCCGHFYQERKSDAQLKQSSDIHPTQEHWPWEGHWVWQRSMDVQAPCEDFWTFAHKRLCTWRVHTSSQIWEDQIFAHQRGLWVCLSWAATI